jgi:hypothetical protein
MAGITRQVIRKAAAASALVVLGSALASGVAHAASTDPPVDGTPVPTYTVDDDPIAIDTNFTVFSGNMHVFHDGSHVRGSLSGSVHATQADRCNRIKVTFFYADGTQDATPRDNAPYPCGTSNSSVYISSDLNKDIVKYSYFTEATGTTSYFWSVSSSVDGLVGDAPASQGTCTQLDLDSVASSGSGVPSFKGQAQYGCNTTTGNTIARLSGTMDNRLVPNGSIGFVDVTFTYADGSTSVVRTGGSTPKLVTDSSGSYYLYQVIASSDSAKDVRAVNVRTGAQQNYGFRLMTYAPQSTQNTSWFGPYNYS